MDATTGEPQGSDPALRVLGPVQVLSDSGPVPLGRRRSRSLLALLAREPGREYPLHALAADLAADASAPEPSLASVRTYLSRLRARLGATGDRVRIPEATEVGYRLQVEAADHLVVRGLAAASERRLVLGDLAGAAAAAERALALRRGRPFDDVDLPAIELHRAELESLLLRLEDLRLRARLDLGDHERLIPEIEVAVRREPLREERTLLLMVARYRCGRQRDALAAVQALRTQLAAAGLDAPTSPISDLERRILDHDPGLGMGLAPLAPTDPAPSRGRPAVAGARSHRWAPTDPPLVGRRQELERMEAGFDEAVRGGGPVLLVSGEAGVGKTRLVQELSDRLVARGASVHWGRCFEAEATEAHRPVAAALRSVVEAHGSVRVAGSSDLRHADLSLLLPELAGTQAAGGAALHGDEALRARDAAAHLVATAARCQPVVLVFDDLQWCDRSSLLLLGHLARHTIDEPVLLVATFRPEEVAGSPIAPSLATLQSDRRVVPIRMAGLTAEGVAELAAATLGPSFDHLDELVARTGGNPLFVQEISRQLAEAGGTGLEALVPESVTALLDRRLAAMSAGSADVVALVSACPGGAPLELLSAVSPGPADRLVDDLELAIDIGVLQEGEQDGLAIVDVAHPLFRDAAYRRLRRARRTQLHDRLATGLEPMARRDPDRWMGELAHHTHHAGATGDPLRAVRACRAAGELALRRTDYDQAAIHLAHALEALARVEAVDPSERARLLLAEAGAHHRAGAAEARTHRADAAFVIAEEVGDWPVAGEAALVHGGTRSTYGEASPRTMELLERARAGLEQRVDPAVTGVRARVTARLAQESYHVGRYALAEDLSAEAQALATETGDDAVVAACAEGAVWALYHPDRAGDRLALTTEMAERAGRAGAPEWEVLALVSARLGVPGAGPGRRHRPGPGPSRRAVRGGPGPEPPVPGRHHGCHPRPDVRPVRRGRGAGRHRPPDRGRDRAGQRRAHLRRPGAGDAEGAGRPGCAHAGGRGARRPVPGHPRVALRPGLGVPPGR